MKLKKLLEYYYEKDLNIRNIIDNFNIYYINLFANNPKLLTRIEAGSELLLFQGMMTELIKSDSLKFQLNDDLIKILLSSARSIYDLRYLFDYISETKTTLNDIKLDTKSDLYINAHNSDKSEKELIFLELLKTPNSKIPDIIKNNIRIVYRDYNNKIFLPQLNEDSILVLKELTEKYGIETNLPPKLISELSEYLK